MMSMQFFHSFLSSKSVITCSQSAGKACPGLRLPVYPCRARARRGQPPTTTSCSPSDGPGSSVQPERCHDHGCGSQPCSLPARSSGHPYCGRRTGSHCSPSPRCTGTHAETRHRLLYGQPSFWKWQGHPPPQSLEAPLCWDQGDVPALSQLPSLPVLLYWREQGPTSVASSLGYVSRKMAKPWKLSLLPNTGPGMRRRCSSRGENWGCTLGSLKDIVVPVGARGGNLLVFHPRKRRDL